MKITELQSYILKDIVAYVSNEFDHGDHKPTMVELIQTAATIKQAFALEGILVELKKLNGEKWK